MIKRRILTKDDILQADDLKIEEVWSPEWKGVAIIMALSGMERDRLEESMFVGEGLDRKQTMENLRAKLVAASVIESKENPIRIFTQEDVVDLGKKSAKALDRVFSAVQKLNGMRAEDVEAMIANLGKGQSESSSSD